MLFKHLGIIAVYALIIILFVPAWLFAIFNERREEKTEDSGDGSSLNR